MHDSVGVQEGQGPGHIQGDAVAGVVPAGLGAVPADRIPQIAPVHELCPPDSPSPAAKAAPIQAIDIGDIHVL